jgi:hypothetical protein
MFDKIDELMSRPRFKRAVESDHFDVAAAEALSLMPMLETKNISPYDRDYLRRVKSHKLVPELARIIREWKEWKNSGSQRKLSNPDKLDPIKDTTRKDIEEMENEIKNRNKHGLFDPMFEGRNKHSSIIAMIRRVATRIINSSNPSKSLVIAALNEVVAEVKQLNNDSSKDIKKLQNEQDKQKKELVNNVVKQQEDLNKKFADELNKHLRDGKSFEDISKIVTDKVNSDKKLHH